MRALQVSVVGNKTTRQSLYDFCRHFLQLASINIASNLMVPLAGLVDVAFLGHLQEIRHLTGVALATVLFDYIYWTFGFLRMGTTGTTAQALGRGDREAVLLTGWRSVLLALGLGLAILILQRPLATMGFALLSAAPEVKAAGLAYYHALIWGAPATLVNFALIGWFLGQAKSSSVLLLSAVGNGANVILDYFFVMRWGWESAGAGAATALSQYLMLLLGIVLVCREVQIRQVRKIASDLFDPQALRAAFALNGNILVRTFALVSTFALFANLSSALGTIVLATNTLILHALSLSAYFIDGIAFATETYAGIFKGEEENGKLVRLLGIAAAASLGLGILFASVFILSPKMLFGILTSHTDVVDRVGQYVLWLLPVLGFGSIAYMLDGYFLGLAEGKVLRNASLISTLVGFVPAAAIAFAWRNVHLLWLAMALFMAARAITLGIKIPQTLSSQRTRTWLGRG